MLQWFRKLLRKWLLGDDLAKLLEVEEVIDEIKVDLKRLQDNQLVIVSVIEDMKKCVPIEGWIEMCQNAVVGLNGRLDNHAEALQSHQQALEAFHNNSIELVYMTEGEDN